MKKMKGAFFVRKTNAVGPEGDVHEGLKRTWFAGIVLGDLMGESEEDQMWYGDLILMEDEPGGAIHFAPQLVLEDPIGYFRSASIGDALESGFQEPRNWRRILLNLTGDDIEVGGD